MQVTENREIEIESGLTLRELTRMIRDADKLAVEIEYVNNCAWKVRTYVPYAGGTKMQLSGTHEDLHIARLSCAQAVRDWAYSQIYKRGV